MNDVNTKIAYDKLLVAIEYLDEAVDAAGEGGAKRIAGRIKNVVEQVNGIACDIEEHGVDV